MSNDLINIEALDAKTVFTGEKPTLETLVNSVKKHVSTFTPDTSTDKGRKEIASMAAKVARSKTALDGLGKDFVAHIKKQTASIDAQRKQMRESLDALKIEVRKPLTEWEEAEAEKERIIQSNLSELQQMASASITDIDRLEDGLRIAKETVIDDTWGKVKVQAELAKKNAIEHLTQKIAHEKNYQKEQAELAAFREAEEKRKQEEADKQAEEARQEREAQIAKDAAQKAEAEALAATARAEQAEKDRVQAEINAKERLEREKEEAIKAERRRIEAKLQADRDEEAKRAANKKHFAAVNNKAKDSLVALGLSDDAARTAIEGIARGQVPNVTISY